MAGKAKFEVFEQPSSRASFTWSPGLIRAALATADSGQLRTIAELCEEILGDDRVQAVFDTRIGGLLALAPSFEASGDGRRKNRAVRALEVDEDWWTIAPEDQLSQVLVYGRLLGVGPYQHVWVEREGRIVPTIRFWHPRHIRQEQSTKRWYTKVRSSRYGETEVEFTPGDGQWGLYAPYGDARPWASGLWRGLSRIWLLKQYAIGDWARLGESASRVVGSSPEGTIRDARLDVAAQVRALGRDGVIVLPAGFDLKLLEVSASTREIYDKQIEFANRATAINVLGQNLTTEVKEGSFAAASVHARVDLQRVKADAQAASTTIHDQTLTWWAEFNFGDRGVAPWPLWPTDLPEDAEKTVKSWDAFGSALEKFQRAGLRIDAPAMAEKVGLPLLPDASPDDTDPAKKPPPAPPTPPIQTGKDAGKVAARRVRLASGDDPQLAAGFVEGQSYADALVDHGASGAAEHLGAFLRSLDGLIEGIDSLESAREKLVQFYTDADAPEDLAAMAERLFVLAHRGGLGAVQQDTPELDFQED